jgi:hypothetical protein
MTSLSTIGRRSAVILPPRMIDRLLPVEHSTIGSKPSLTNWHAGIGGR